MSRRTKREMAPPPHQTGSAPAPAYQIGSAPSTIHVPTPVPALLGGGSTIPNTGGQSAWWPGPLPQATSSGATSSNCGMDYYPPGGFMSFFQTGQQQFIPHVSAPWRPMGKETQLTPPSSDSGNQNAKKRSKGKTIINLDDGNDARTGKCLVFDKEEDERLVSAWLIHSNDPINGNCKKNESYWGDVRELYNSTTPTNRRREVKHLKDRWQKIKRLVGFFCACWKKVTSVYLSGYSDDQLRDMAMQFYLDDYPKEGPFTVLHCWKVLHDEPKWLAVLEDLEKPNKRSLDDEDEISDISGMPKGVGEKERPIGTKQAKKQCNGKGRVNDDDAGLDEDLKKYIDIQAAAKKRQEDFLEAQQCISDRKVETARLMREAALLESYQKLLCMDTREMTEEIRAEHAIGLKILRDKLAGNSN